MGCKFDVSGQGRSALMMALLALTLVVMVGRSWSAEPPCGAAEFRQFDFWLGHWQVQLADGTQAGVNRIESLEQGCVLEERWTGAQGSTGRSYNFYDPASRRWRQVWVSPGSIIDITGGLGGGSMVLEGTIVYSGKAEKHPFRGSWTPLEDGRVRQFFEQLSVDQDSKVATWQPWFEGFYSRIPSVSPTEG